MLGIKPTRIEIEERTEAAGQYWAAGLTFGQLKTSMHERFGMLDHRTVMRYLTRARKQWHDECGDIDRDAQRGEALEFYRQQMRNSKTSDRVKVRARERIDCLLGLDAPTRTELSGINGKPLQIESIPKPPIDFERLGTLRRSLLGIPSPNGNGQPVHPAHAAPASGNGAGNNGH
jgi:hypothetical protein